MHDAARLLYLYNTHGTHATHNMTRRRQYDDDDDDPRACGGGGGGGGGARSLARSLARAHVRWRLRWRWRSWPYFDLFRFRELAGKGCSASEPHRCTRLGGEKR